MQTRTLLFIFVTASFLSAACNKNDGIKIANHDSNKMMTIMHAMMSQMEAMTKSNDPEVDFAKMMTMHHQGAINMANLELQAGKNDSLKRTAQKIITEQQAEIQQFNTIISGLTVDNTDASFSAEQSENMMKMGKVSDAQLITDDIDNDFATLMIVHHQAAIDNASAYLHHGNHTQLKMMANNIVMSQNKEIEELAVWLKTYKR
ncbi:MAG: DUF305 domain-containing protein [Williamsia sp.]|nr:DUF305 domain-containing protein [Williamsia sp.]